MNHGEDASFEGLASDLALKDLASKETFEALSQINGSFSNAEKVLKHLKGLVITRARVVALEGRNTGTWKRVGDSDVEISRKVVEKILERPASVDRARREINANLKAPKTLELTDEKVRSLYGDMVSLAAFFHEVGNEVMLRAYGDVGERAGHGSIRLSPIQRRLIHEHPDRGARDVSLRPLADMIRDHHERFDGRGYPRGVTGEAASLGGRIIALCSSAQAIVNGRSFDVAHPTWYLAEEIRRCSGREYDRARVIKYLREEAYTRALSELAKASLASDMAQVKIKDETDYFKQKYLVEVEDHALNNHPRMMTMLQFDPQLADVFLELFGDELKGKAP